MNKKILISLSIIGAVAAIVVGGTIAYFSDTETSTGNTFTAGTLDLKVDSECHYNGMVCTEGKWVGPTGGYPEADTDCACTWLEKDLDGDLFFNFTDVKPGDFGENTVSLHVYDNDAYVCGYVFNLANDDNGLTEPESKVDATDGAGNGELQDNILVTIWRDDGKDAAGAPAGEDCDNIQNDGEEVLVSGVPIDRNTGGWYLGELAGDTETCLGVAWEVQSSVGNIIQSDSVTGDIYFYVEQVRNNPNFQCPQPITVESSMLHFSSTGWGGWSCPAGKKVVGGSTDCTLPLAVSEAAKPGMGTYPVYSHYTYTPPEEGWVVQNGGTGQSCKISVDCF